ncbi:hemolysin family protein [Actinomyces ruminis]|uniref:HlyC/CorC family transporter n=1 Tax=Actinomyces ruminis TaxID=1937003 RepID=A0ABX4MCR8_9ACTO|nr:hemolysin family protein [Actinomyces ruminis]PHP53254.1 HlyC/CorC family transporter [Actinomyces ruminis]
MDPLLRNCLLVVLFILVGACFSAAEMALVSLRPTQIEDLAGRGGAGRVVKRLTSDSNQFLSAVQVGVTIAGFFSASFGAAQIAPALAPVLNAMGFGRTTAATLAFVAVTLLIAYVSVVVGELVPKRIAMQSAQTVALLAARPLAAITGALRPVIWLLGVSTNVLLRGLGRDPATREESIGLVELRALIQAQESIGAEERRMVLDLLAVGERTVVEAMTPCTEVEFVGANLTIAQARAALSGLEHSRYPVRRGRDDDDVVGYVHLRDLIAPIDDSRRVAEIARSILLLPKTLPVVSALTQMRAAHAHIALVVDEYGGTDGIVTLEDVVEEFTGQIIDEYDREESAVVHRDDTVVIDGLATRTEVGRALGHELPAGPFDTLGGFIMAELGRIPRVDDVVAWDGLRLRVTALDGRRVDKVAVAELDASAGRRPGTRGQAAR